MPLSMNLYLKEVQISTFVSSVAKMILKFYLDQLPVFLRKRHTEEAYMTRKSLCGYTLQARVDYTALIQYGGWIGIKELS